MLHGGENLLDKVEALEARSEAAAAQLEVAARQQQEQQRRLDQLQLERLDLNAQYSSLEVWGPSLWWRSRRRQSVGVEWARGHGVPRDDTSTAGRNDHTTQ